MNLKDEQNARELVRRLQEQPGKVLFGLEKAIFSTVMALITPIPRDGKRGKEWACAHTYLLELPGRGKTALFNYLAAAISAKLGRIDGRADMMPSDLTGGELVDPVTKTRTMKFGPIFCNILFADEINRSPSKAQAPMLGAMEGASVILNKMEENAIIPKAYPIYPISEDPNEKRLFFIVLATANPIEFEGTYQMSEAQLDRFTYCFPLGLPGREAEKMIRGENVVGKSVETIMDLETFLEIHEMVKQVKLATSADEYQMRLIENSRPTEMAEELKERPRRFATRQLQKFIDENLKSGCSPRRNFHMEYAAKAYAWMMGSSVATVEHMRAIAPVTMEHVILLKISAMASLANRITPRIVVKKIIEETAVPLL